MASIGTTLREERIRLGLGIDQVEADTKIRAKYLMALEDERFEALPGTAYARAFLRDYAEQLGLDPQELVNRLNTVVGTDVAGAATTTGPPPHATSTRFVFHAGPGNTWLQVRKASAGGRVLYADVLTAGSHIKLSGRKLWVTAGAPWNLSVKADGHALAVPSNAKSHLLVTRTDVRAVA